jgi:hypothetical protein
MPDTFYALLTLAGALLGIWLWIRKSGTKEERRRAKAIADATARRHEQLSEDEQVQAEEMHALADEHRTGEQRIVRKQQHLSSIAAVARRYRRPAKHSARKLPKPPKSKRFDPLTSPLRGQLEKPVMLPDAPPEPFLNGEFTEARWHVGDIDRWVAQAKAATG